MTVGDTYYQPKRRITIEIIYIGNLLWYPAMDIFENYLFRSLRETLVLMREQKAVLYLYVSEITNIILDDYLLIEK